jgi:anti-anti-sigma factor
VVRSTPQHPLFAVLIRSFGVDAVAAPVLRRDLTAALQRGGWVVINRGKVTSLDFPGLRVLVASRRRARQWAGDLALVGPRPNVATELAISGPTSVSVRFDTAHAARSVPWAERERV